MYQGNGWHWVTVGALARVEAGAPGVRSSEYGRIAEAPDDGPDFSDALGTVRTFTGELITTPMLYVAAISQRDLPLVQKLEADAPTRYAGLELNEAQWHALKRACDEGGVGSAGNITGQTAQALARRGLVVYYSYVDHAWPPGSGPSINSWHCDATALGRQAWEHHTQPPAPAQPKRVKIPGLSISVPVREEPPAVKIPEGVHLMKEGFPEGRYAVEIDGQVHCFWFQYHRTGPKRFQEETRYRREDGKWVSTIPYVRELKRAIELIKEDSYTQAVRFGTHTEHCSNCGRRLTRGDSRKRGLGDRCAMEAIHKETLRRLFG